LLLCAECEMRNRLCVKFEFANNVNVSVVSNIFVTATRIFGSGAWQN
jgi:hypothetical protein